MDIGTWNPEKPKRFHGTTEARFWSKVDKRGPDDCWLWLAGKAWSGYGLICDGNRSRVATQVALELDGRPRPPAPGNLALHGDTCVSRACVNPAHLRWGSYVDNASDRDRLGRHRTAVGERHRSAKLTAAKVQKIRRMSATHREIARLFGVAHSAIGKIKRGVTWRHVT